MMKISSLLCLRFVLLNGDTVLMHFLLIVACHIKKKQRRNGNDGIFVGLRLHIGI